MSEAPRHIQDMQTLEEQRAARASLLPRRCNEVPVPYVPTPEEVASNSFTYCFEQPVIPLRPLEESDESDQ